MNRRGTANRFFGAINGFVTEAAAFYRLTARFIVDTAARHQATRRELENDEESLDEGLEKEATHERLQDQSQGNQDTEYESEAEYESKAVREVDQSISRGILSEPSGFILGPEGDSSLSPVDALPTISSPDQAWSSAQTRSQFRGRLVEVLQEWELQALLSASTIPDLCNTANSILAQLSSEDNELADRASSLLIEALQWIGLEVQNVEAPSSPEESDIEKYVRVRQISHLIHFTRLENLPLIMNEGLLSNQQLVQMGRTVLDPLRLDGRPGHVCTSISFPNYQMFFLLRQGNPSGWCVILIRPSVMWENECLFYPYNAARADLAARPLSDFRGIAALNEMFAETVCNRQRHSCLSMNQTTSPQAEVMVPSRIAPEDFLSVEFSSRDQASECQEILGQASVRSYWSDRFFRPRCDFEQWRNR